MLKKHGWIAALFVAVAMVFMACPPEPTTDGDPGELGIVYQMSEDSQIQGLAVDAPLPNTTWLEFAGDASGKVIVKDGTDIEAAGDRTLYIDRANAANDYRSIDIKVSSNLAGYSNLRNHTITVVGKTYDPSGVAAPARINLAMTASPYTVYTAEDYASDADGLFEIQHEFSWATVKSLEKVRIRMASAQYSGNNVDYSKYSIEIYNIIIEAVGTAVEEDCACGCFYEGCTDCECAAGECCDDCEDLCDDCGLCDCLCQGHVVVEIPSQDDTTVAYVVPTPANANEIYLDLNAAVPFVRNDGGLAANTVKPAIITAADKVQYFFYPAGAVTPPASANPQQMAIPVPASFLTNIAGAKTVSLEIDGTATSPGNFRFILGKRGIENWNASNTTAGTPSAWGAFNATKSGTFNMNASRISEITHLILMDNTTHIIEVEITSIKIVVVPNVKCCDDCDGCTVGNCLTCDEDGECCDDCEWVAADPFSWSLESIPAFVSAAPGANLSGGTIIGPNLLDAGSALEVIVVNSKNAIQMTMAEGHGGWRGLDIQSAALPGNLGFRAGDVVTVGITLTSEVSGLQALLRYKGSSSWGDNIGDNPSLTKDVRIEIVRTLNATQAAAANTAGGIRIQFNSAQTDNTVLVIDTISVVRE